MTGPLEGIRVLDFSRALAGALATTILADLGAEVIMIESPRRAPGGLSKGGFVTFIFQGIDARYNYEARGKKSLLLDFQSLKGKEVLYELVKRSDVVLDNWRAGTSQRLGLDYDTLKGINPKIITCSITGYGSTGPYKDRPCYDTIAAAQSGLLSVGDPSSPPSPFGPPLVDDATGIYAAQGVTAALYHREKTGEGQRVEVCLLDVAVSLLTYFPTMYFASGIIPRPKEQAWGQVAVAGIFKTQDDYIATGVITDRHWRPFCKALGREEWADDPKFSTEVKRVENRGILLPLVREVLASKTTSYWVDALVREGVPVAPVNPLDKALSDPQVIHSNIIITIQGAEGKPVKVPGNPIRMSSAPTQFYGPAPARGQHTEEILRQVLNYPQQKIEELRQEGVI